MRVDRESKKIKCKCSKRSLKPTSVVKHSQSKTHKNYTQMIDDKRECSICLEDKEVFFVCKNCMNEICSSCKEHLIAPKCPYCRTPFKRLRNSTNANRRQNPHPPTNRRNRRRNRVPQTPSLDTSIVPNEFISLLEERMNNLLVYLTQNRINNRRLYMNILNSFEFFEASTLQYIPQ